MATRIYVCCKTEEMPGLLRNKISLMANAACQKVWNRDFNKDSLDNDRLVTLGGFINTRCFLLIDNGPVDAKEYSVIRFHWKKHELLDEPGLLHPYIQKQFETVYQFNPADRPKPIEYTDKELKQVLSPEAYDKRMQVREEQLARAKAKYSEI